MHDAYAEIESRLREQLAPIEFELIDDSAAHHGHEGARGGAGHFKVRIVSDRFRGLGRLARHRLVYDPLADLMPHRVHALNILALTPEEAVRS